MSVSARLKADGRGLMGREKKNVLVTILLQSLTAESSPYPTCSNLQIPATWI